MMEFFELLNKRGKLNVLHLITVHSTIVGCVYMLICYTTLLLTICNTNKIKLIRQGFEHVYTIAHELFN